MSAACCAGVLPLRAAAPPLRLMLAKTLMRFAQHEAIRVRIPPAQCSKEPKTKAITFFKVKMAEEEGFEPSYPGYRVNGFRDRRIQPLCHSSVGVKHGASQGRAMRRCWRRVRDLNPGDAFGAYTISNRAPSATRTTLRENAQAIVPYLAANASGNFKSLKKYVRWARGTPAVTPRVSGILCAASAWMRAPGKERA